MNPENRCGTVSNTTDSAEDLPTALRPLRAASVEVEGRVARFPSQRPA
jgi:hypothetical protein